MTNDPRDFEQIAISRDLVRKPEIRTLALTLARINSTGPVDKNEIPPIYVQLAHRLLTRKEARQLLLATLEALSD